MIRTCGGWELNEGRGGSGWLVNDDGNSFHCDSGTTFFFIDVYDILGFLIFIFLCSDFSFSISGFHSVFIYWYTSR